MGSLAAIAAVLRLESEARLPFATVATAVSAFSLLLLLGYLYYFFFSRPQRLLKQLHAQGISGFPFRPFLGQLPELIKHQQQELSVPELAASKLGSFWLESSETYGPAFTFSFGSIPCLILLDPSLVREAFTIHNDALDKPTWIKDLKLLGQGVVSSDGELWHSQRRLLNPAFSNREIKRIFPTMLECSEAAMLRLEEDVRASCGKPVMMDEHLSRVTLDVICRSAFGSEIEGMFDDTVLETLLKSFAQYLKGIGLSFVFSSIFPLFKYLPTAGNRSVWRAGNVIKSAMKRIITERVARHKQTRETSKAAEQPLRNGVVGEEPDGGRTDLLELMLNAAEGSDALEGNGDQHLNGQDRVGVGRSIGKPGNSTSFPKSFSQELIMDNCTSFFIAGHETTAVTLTWASYLLGKHPEWQEKLRAEVNNVCGGSAPTFDQVGQLKQIGWVLNETLRMFPPAIGSGRVSNTAVKLSEKITIPKGCTLQVPFIAMHYNPEFWGEDARAFRPERFANGISKAATNPSAFMPFTMGPRVCIGQNFAMIEAKVILAMLLKRFSWKVPDAYVVIPDAQGTLRPKGGLPLLITCSD